MAGAAGPIPDGHHSGWLAEPVDHHLAPLPRAQATDACVTAPCRSPDAGSGVDRSRAAEEAQAGLRLAVDWRLSRSTSGPGRQSLSAKAREALEMKLGVAEHGVDREHPPVVMADFEFVRHSDAPM